MFLLTLRDMQYRALRFGISVVGTAVVLSMVLLMTGLSAGFRVEPQTTVASFGADAWIVPEGVSGPFTGGVAFPADLADSVGVSDGGRVDPLLVARQTLVHAGDDLDVVIIGYGRGGLGEPALEIGRLPGASGEVVADRLAGHDVGDTARVGTASLDVVGLSDDATLFAGVPLLAMPLAQAQDLFVQDQPVATALLVRGELTGPPPPGFVQLSPDDVWRDALRPVAKSTGAIDLVNALLWVVAATILGAVVYLSALERRRDFAVLKAIGTTSRSLLVGLAAQSVLVALLGALLAMALQALLRPLFPLPVRVPPAAFVQLPLLAAGVALVVSTAALRRAVAVDPALAFAGPGA